MRPEPTARPRPAGAICCLTGTSRRATIFGIRIEYDDAIMESRKQAVRDVWAYRPVEHIPVMLSVAGNPWEYSVKDQLFDAEKQLAVCLRGVELSLERVPDDYIPNAFVTMGAMPSRVPSAAIAFLPPTSSGTGAPRGRRAT